MRPNNIILWEIYSVSAASLQPKSSLKIFWSQLMKMPDSRNANTAAVNDSWVKITPHSNDSFPDGLKGANIW